MRIEIIKEAKPVKMFNRYNRRFYMSEVIDVEAEAEKQIELPSGFLGSALPPGKEKRLLELGIAKVVSSSAQLKSAEDILAERQSSKEAEKIKFEKEDAERKTKEEKKAKSMSPATENKAINLAAENK